MKKSDLKTGMIVTLRRGGKYLVLKDISSYFTNVYKPKDCIVSIDDSFNWNGLEYYNEDLTHAGLKGGIISPEEDIMMVEQINHPCDIRATEMKKLKLLWKRPEPIKEITMEELEEHFGCKVKIVK